MHTPYFQQGSFPFYFDAPQQAIASKKGIHIASQDTIQALGRL